MRVLYAGDGPIGGAADYLLGLLRSVRAQVRHVLPTQTLTPRLLQAPYDLIILSDFPRARAPQATQRAIGRQVAEGAGLLMVGGWASFAGPRGGWRGSLVETMLPVACRRQDDRRAFPGGALMAPLASHPSVRGLSFASPPVICGLNRLRVTSRGRVVLGARAILARPAAVRGRYRMALSAELHPLLVVSDGPRGRAAALATDVAPHWCGGLVDWGRPRRLRVTRAVTIEVGEQYVRFVTGLLRWLGRRA